MVNHTEVDHNQFIQLSKLYITFLGNSNLVFVVHLYLPTFKYTSQVISFLIVSDPCDLDETIGPEETPAAQDPALDLETNGKNYKVDLHIPTVLKYLK